MKEKKRLSNKDFLLEFFVLFLYIKLHLLQIWRGYKKNNKKMFTYYYLYHYYYYYSNTTGMDHDLD